VPVLISGTGVGDADKAAVLGEGREFLAQSNDSLRFVFQDFDCCVFDLGNQVGGKGVGISIVIKHLVM
jgi:hypothetical protein